MRSQLDERLGTELPQIIHAPSGVVSLATADDTIELANRYQICDGFPLSPSQEIRLRNAMGEREDGTWAAKRVGDFGGRQGAGKSAIVMARALGGMLLVDERLLIYTAHEFPTANEIFLRFGQIFEAWDDLAALVLHERRAHGDQGFELRGPPGSEITGKRRLLFKTRTGKSGRGFAKADLLVYDEAQHLKPEHVAGAGPARLANPLSQSWYAGSGGFEGSDVAWAMRKQAILGTSPTLAYAEHTAETIEVVDGRIKISAPEPDDRSAWYRANPGLGRWVAIEDMAALSDELEDLFARECLCVWETPPEDVVRVIPLDRWDALTDGESQVEESHRVALDAPRSLRSASFAVAGKRTDKLLHVEVGTYPRDNLDTRPIAEQIIDVAKQLTERHSTKLIIPPGSPAEAWKQELVAAGVELDEMSPADYKAACGAIVSHVFDGTLRHRGQPDLTAAVAGLRERPSGDVDVWSRRSSTVNIAPFVAATCALGRVPTSVRQVQPMGAWR